MTTPERRTRWSDEQARALDSIRQWLKRKDQEIFRLFGYAGTGKTELATEIASMVDAPVMYASYTGKASLVLSRRVGREASTLHRLIYRPLDTEEDGTRKTIWVLDEDSPLGEAGLLVVDEVSMVDEAMARDLLSFGVPLLVLGDPFQLPPIKRTGFFTSTEPDAMLTEVYRHDGPILELATAIREGERWRDHPHVITHEPEDLGSYDIVICGTHETRRRINALMRDGKGEEPEPGDKVICIRNDYTLGVFNGQTFTVASSGGSTSRHHELDLQDDAREVLSVGAPVEDFGANECQGFANGSQRHRRMACLIYGYAITAHKAQGSQWDDVLVIDESHRFKESARWLYTAVTRAAENVTVVTAPLDPITSQEGYWD